MGTYHVPLQSPYKTYLPYLGLKAKKTKKKAGFSKKSWVKKNWVFKKKLGFLKKLGIQGISKVRSDLFCSNVYCLFNVTFQKLGILFFAYFSFDYFNY